MNWQKLGLLFNPNCLENKGLTAALMPIAEVIDEKEGIVRVFFTPRDQKQRSEVHYFDFNINNLQILNISEESLLKHGTIGSFDDSGITLGSIVKHENQKYLYYTGWNLLVNVPMNNSIGFAVLENHKFMRIGLGPIMTRTLSEPYSCASPFVMFDDDGVFKMWYASMDKWIESQNGPKHYYNIKYASSVDGINWERKGKVCIDYENDDEYAFGRPFVLKEEGLYKMWYCYRGAFYKIGYAESIDGLTWVRKDYLAGINISDEGWDSEMLDYPYIFDFNDNRYMLYNGNGYGKTGIGIAQLIM